MSARRSVSNRQAGLTLAELMVALLVGLIVTLASTSLLLSVLRSHRLQDDLLRVDENGRFALDVIARTARHAGFAIPDDGRAATMPGPVLIGLDAASLHRDSDGISDAVAGGVNGSDVLAVRHGVSGRYAIPNCAGFRGGEAEQARTGWSIFYVARDARGEPQLYCKYEGEHGWNADAIVGGIEAFQVLYGVDSNEDGLPDRMLSAAAVGAPDETDAWNRVVMIRVGLLVRGAERGEAGRGSDAYDLFGPAYSEERAAEDAGVRLSEAELNARDGPRLRRLVQATVYLRNPAKGGAP